MDKFDDYRGKAIQKGTLVAYNQSGDVVIGMVESVEMTPSGRKWIPFNYIIRVKKIGSKEPCKISIVKNHLCIVSIDQGGE